MNDDLERPPYLHEDPEAARIRLVVVDDHPTYAHGLATLLEDVGPDIEVVGIATDPVRAIDLIAERQPDVVLLDVHMPRLKGTEAAERIRLAAPSSALLFLTVSEDISDIAAAMRAGGRGYLFKDVEPDELVHAIRAVARGKVVLAPAAAQGLVEGNGEAATLTPHEIEAFRLLSSGVSHMEAAARLAVSESTLKRQLAHAQKKLNLDNRMQAIAYLARRGLL